jgi:hypothetical protein
MDAPFPDTLIPDWDRLAGLGREALVLDATTGVCEEVFNSPVLFPLQRKRELRRMLAVAANINARTVMEIGADKGGGLLHWCLLPTVQNIIACEIRGCPYQRQLAGLFPDKNFAWMERGSQPPPHHFPWPIDVLFIDGDKNLTLQDFDRYLHLMNPNGIVLIHDINDRPPGNAFRQIAERGYRYDEILDQSESFEELGKEGPPSNPHAGWLRHWQGLSCGVGVIYLAGGKIRRRR